MMNFNFFKCGLAVIQTNLGIFEYVIIFFGALGLGSQIQKSRKPTIPSNQTP